MIPYEELVAALSRWRAAQGLPTGPADYLGEPAPVRYDYMSSAMPAQPGMVVQEDVVDLSDEMLDGVVEESQVDPYQPEAAAYDHGEAEDLAATPYDAYAEPGGYQVAEGEEIAHLAEVGEDSEPYQASSSVAEAFGDETFAGEPYGEDHLAGGEPESVEYIDASAAPSLDTHDEEIDAMIDGALPADEPTAEADLGGPEVGADPPAGRRKRRR
jgi:hypothetical protein